MKSGEAGGQGAAIELDDYEKIRYLHEHEGRSQRVIAKLLEISRYTVKQYFDGSRWIDLFENEMMVAALIDRVTFKSHILNMDVKDSYRFLQMSHRGNEG